MKSAPRPEDEQQRLSALREYQILDTLPEPAYDDITRIAAQICDTPIALISLVDENRQWFKSHLGVEATETPRDRAFCAHAILEPDSLLVIEDATADPRFADNPLVTGPPGIRFYAGAPLVTADGHALGTLCVIDRESRTLTSAQNESLKALARQVIAQMELRRSVTSLQRNAETLARRNDQVVRSRDELASLCRLLEDQAAVTERDLNRAEVIQRSLLPHSLPKLKDVSVHTLYRPGRSIGGDLFDVEVLDNRYLALVMADAAGHGVSAAMISMLFKNHLRATDSDGRPYRPCEALERLNKAMQTDKPAPGVFVTAMFCLFDMEQRSLLVASAGHPPLICLRRDGSNELVPHTGPALGLYTDAVYGEQRLRLEHGDRVLIYTDGLLDAAPGDDVPTPEEISRVLREVAEEDNTLGALLGHLTGGQEDEDRDDVSMILLDTVAGENHLDEPAELHATGRETDRAAPQMRYAESPDATFLVLEGRVTWLCGQALLDSALSVLDSGRPLIIDLQRCDYLDSTLLGTLHELCEWAQQRSAAAPGGNDPLILQNVPQNLEDAFRELSMTAVLERITGDARAVPAQQHAVQLPEQSRTAHQKRLLKAHQVLADLSDENRDEFASVIDALRGDK